MYFQKLEDERKRFRVKFPSFGLSYDDCFTCQRLLATYERWNSFGDRLQNESENLMVEETVAKTAICESEFLCSTTS